MTYTPRHTTPRKPRVARRQPLLRRTIAAISAGSLVALSVATPVMAGSPVEQVAALGPAMAARVGSLPTLAATAKRWWTAPVVGASCSSPFGWRRFYDSRLKKWREGMHNGRDLTRYRRAPVGAVANGTVISAGWRGGYGYAVEIRHGKGRFTSLYAHLAQITVRKGQWVNMGNLIGRMGSTGDSTGVHTHFEVRDWGTAINPDVFMRARGVRLC